MSIHVHPTPHALLLSPSPNTHYLAPAPFPWSAFLKFAPRCGGWGARVQEWLYTKELERQTEKQKERREGMGAAEAEQEVKTEDTTTTNKKRKFEAVDPNDSEAHTHAQYYLAQAQPELQSHYATTKAYAQHGQTEEKKPITTPRRNNKATLDSASQKSKYNAYDSYYNTSYSDSNPYNYSGEYTQVTPAADANTHSVRWKMISKGEAQPFVNYV